MGASLVQRLTKDGHKCVVYDVNPAAVEKIVGRGVGRQALGPDFQKHRTRRQGGAAHSRQEGEGRPRFRRARIFALRPDAGAGHFVKMVHKGI